MVRLSKDCLPRGPIQVHPTLTMLSLEGPQSVKHCQGLQNPTILYATSWQYLTVACGLRYCFKYLHFTIRNLLITLGHIFGTLVLKDNFIGQFFQHCLMWHRVTFKIKFKLSEWYERPFLTRLLPAPVASSFITPYLCLTPGHTPGTCSAQTQHFL